MVPALISGPLNSIPCLNMDSIRSACQSHFFLIFMGWCGQYGCAARAWGRSASQDSATVDAPPQRAVHSQPRLEARKGPFREAVKSLFLILATLHGGGKREVSSSHPR